MSDSLVLGQPQVDATDPVFVGLSWFVTWLVGKLSSHFELEWLRPWLPWVAAAVAMGLRALYDVALQGGDLTLEVAMRAFATGAAAVWGHTAVRGVQKSTEQRRKKKRQQAEPVDGA